MPVIDEIRGFHDELTEWRRDIHAHPELGFQEQRTSDLVAERLDKFGIEVHRGIGKTGVVGRLRVGNSPRTIGLRAVGRRRTDSRPSRQYSSAWRREIRLSHGTAQAPARRPNTIV